jgi:hypothetical protein
MQALLDETSVSETDLAEMRQLLAQARTENRGPETKED